MVLFACPQKVLIGQEYINHVLTNFPISNQFAVDNAEPIPLMEGEGKSFRVLGFNQSQRAAFVQILMRSVLQL